MNPQDSQKPELPIPLPPILTPSKINNSTKSKELQQERPESRRSQRNPRVGISTPVTTSRNGFITEDDDEWSKKVGFNTNYDRFN